MLKMSRYILAFLVIGLYSCKKKHDIIKYIEKRDKMIKKASLEDLEEVYQLMCILENKELNKEHFIQVYKQGLENSDLVYLVYKKEKVLGFISFIVHHYMHHDKDTGEIIELVVLPECRSQRIGDQLIREVEKIAVERNLEQIELSTSTYRKDAHRFYENHGYVKDHYNYTKNF